MRKTPSKFVFQNFLIIMNTILTYRLPNISFQEHQDVDCSSSGGESTTSKLHTNPVDVNKTPGCFDEDYTVRLTDGVSLIERNVATQTSHTFKSSELPIPNRK